MQQILNDTLTNIYKRLNRKYFANSLLPLPVISTTGENYLACCCTKNEWPVLIKVSIDNARSDNPAEEITAAILHEMVHAYCIVNHIPHYDPETGSHLQGFVKAAEEHGLFYDDFLNTNFIIDDETEEITES